jgi:hypothetical protein
MIKGSIDARKKLFIREMINGGTESVARMIIAYKKAYPQCKKDESARSSGYRLIQEVAVQQAITKGMQQREEMMKAAQAKEIQRIAAEQIASQTQIEAKLSQIALGTHKRKRVIAGIDIKSGKIVKGEIDEQPSERDMVAAADKLLRIKGSYAKDNVVKHEAGDTWIEAMKLLAKKKKEN